MIYFFEHPILSGVVPVEDKEVIKKLNEKLNKTGFIEGQEINLDNTPPIYVKIIDEEEGMVILSKDK